MGNDKQVLPVSHWLEVVIAFVSSSFLIYTYTTDKQTERQKINVFLDKEELAGVVAGVIG